MFIAPATYKIRVLPAELRSRAHLPVRACDYAPSRWCRMRRWLRRFWKRIWQRTLAGMVTLLAAAIALQCHYEDRAAAMDITTYNVFQQRNELYDSRGRYLRALPGPTTRKCVAAAALPPLLVKATVAVEDEDFFSHNGVNKRGVARAAWHDVTTGSLAQGGSSITQQSVKLWLDRNDESAWDKIDRKLLEWQLARRIERELSKEEILANYFNRIDWGASLHGAIAAAEGFFGKDIKDLNIIEVATIVAIIRGPDDYSPIKHPERTRARRNLVLRRIAEVFPELLSRAEAQRLSAQPMILALDSWRRKQAPEVISILAQQELEKAVSPEMLANGDLRVMLTIDSAWNTAVSDAAEQHLRSIEARRGPSDAPLQAAATVIDAKSGAILVMLGGRPSAGGQLNRVTQLNRDPGSAIKPFTYCLYFGRGANLDDLIDAGPIRTGELSFGPPNYSPENAGGTNGTITVREALEKSVNTPAIRVGDKVGIETFAEFLDRLGIVENRAIPRSPTAFLGNLGVSPLELAAGYTIFVNRGVRCPDPHIVESVSDGTGAVVFAFAKSGEQACPPEAADKTAECLRGVMTRGTGRAATALGLRQPCLGKTGTTNDVKDVWFAGATTDATCVVWVGYDRPKHILNAYAAQLALPLWVRVINAGGIRQSSASVARGRR